MRTGQFQTIYWDYDFSSTNKFADYREYSEELSRLFGQAVGRQLVSDVEIGCYLSGGMDSGSITAIASQKLSHLKTFTCGFDMSSASGIELGFDERSRLRQYHLICDRAIRDDTEIWRHGTVSAALELSSRGAKVGQIP